MEKLLDVLLALFDYLGRLWTRKTGQFCSLSKHTGHHGKASPEVITFRLPLLESRKRLFAGYAEPFSRRLVNQPAQPILVYDMESVTAAKAGCMLIFPSPLSCVQPR